MDNNYKKILNQIINYEDALLTQKLSTATFTDILKRVLFLRKQYNIDFTEKYFETSQFLNFLKSLLIRQEKYMSNSTFDSVLNIMTNIHKEFERKDAQQIFINREIEYLAELSKNMSHRSHSMTTRRLNEIGNKKIELQKQEELIKWILKNHLPSNCFA